MFNFKEINDQIFEKYGNNLKIIVRVLKNEIQTIKFAFNEMIKYANSS